MINQIFKKIIALGVVACTFSLPVSQAAPKTVELCPAQQAIFYFLPGETNLDAFGEALLVALAQRSHTCLIDRLEIDSFADDTDGRIETVSAGRAQTLLGALGERGIAALDVSVRLHMETTAQDRIDQGAPTGRRAIVRIRMRDKLGPMS